jgi:hypothetical protein
MIQVFWLNKGVYTGKKITDVFTDSNPSDCQILKTDNMYLPYGSTQSAKSMKREITLKMSVRTE